MNRIRQAMDKAGIKSVAALSRLSGVSYGTLYDLVNDVTDIGKTDVSKFLKIAHALGMTAEELYTGKSDETVLTGEQRRMLDALDNVPPTARPTVIAMVEGASGGAHVSSREVRSA